MGCAHFVRGRWSFYIAFALVALAMGQRAVAQTWDGGGADNNWLTGLNWNANLVPDNNGSANIVLAGMVRLTPNVDVAWNINSLSIDTTAGAFVLGGAQLTIQGGGISTNGTIGQTETINNAIVLGTDQTWTTNGFPTLVINGAVNLNGHNLTSASAAPMTLGGVISGA